MRVYTCDEMRQIEQRADAGGLSYRQMMENAGWRATAILLHWWRQSHPAQPVMRVAIFCGKGGNGGDGLVMARHLSAAGMAVVVVLCQGQPVPAHSAANLQLLRGRPIPIYQLGEAAVDQLAAEADVLIDAVYGTGFHGEMDDRGRQAAALMNSASGTVWAVDVPSGVAGDSGHIDPGAVQANFTVALHSYKPAHLVYPAAGHSGQLVLADIGIPASCDPVQPAFHVTDAQQVFTALPPRQQDTHKGDFGKLLAVVSSGDMPGAGQICTAGALRVGTGLVRVAIPRPLVAQYAPHLLEAVYLPLPQSEDGSAAPGAAPVLEKALADSTACVVGCGMGTGQGPAQLLQYLLQHAACPLLLDADALGILSQSPDWLNGVKAPLVLTPHPGEMARLLGISTGQLVANKLQYGRQFIEKYPVTLVLKGAHTLVFSPGCPVAVNPTGNPGMSKAGSGDLLSGIIGGLLAQGLSPYLAAVCGVWLHGAAGDRCAARLSQTAMLPTDMQKDLSDLFLVHHR